MGIMEKVLVKQDMSNRVMDINVIINKVRGSLEQSIDIEDGLTEDMVNDAICMLRACDALFNGVLDGVDRMAV